jgi:O-methyltransferase involved in polyketide biosynthesis
VVVIEGVFMYLEQKAIEQMLQTIRRLFPQHKLICDLMTRKFFERYNRTMYEKILGMGATFKFTVDNPEEVFLKNGYSRIERISMVERAVELDSMKIPKILLKTLLRTLANGYAIYVFESC